MGVTKNMKANKKEIFIAFLFGVALLFVVNNWTNQQAYDFVSCTYNANSCEDLEWDGECTSELEEECCDYMDVDMCGGQEVTNPYDCYHYYCEDDAKFCDGQYDDVGGSGKYICTCTDIWQDI